MINLIENLYLSNGLGGISGLYSIIGSFGAIDGLNYNDEIIKTENEFHVIGRYDTIEIQCVFKYDEQSDTYKRIDYVKNTGNNVIEINSYHSRFAFEGANFEVYMQSNGWQNENQGAWLPLLNSQVAKCRGMRVGDGFNPFAAIWSDEHQKGLALHLMPKSQWKIDISKVCAYMEKEYTTINYGVEDSGFAYKLSPGEKIEMAEALFCIFDNKTNMGSYKVHQYINKQYPRTRLPVLYNTWLLNFDRINIDEIKRQIDAVSNLGAEYFVIDAGWFGDGSAWSGQVGNWIENQHGAFCGNLNKIADYIRQKGMKFGLWLEPERAVASAAIVKEHPEYFMPADLESYVLDFSCSEAVDYITKVTLGLIEQYGIEMFKIDCNATASVDLSRKSFYDYYQGLFRYLNTIKKHYPDIYIENCSAGGLRNDLEEIKHFDTCFISDQISPYALLDIYFGLILRIPPAFISKWAVTAVADGFINSYFGKENSRFLSCADALWERVESIDQDFLMSYMKGGTVGICGNVANLDEKRKEFFKEEIVQYKNDREFWQNCMGIVLQNTPNVKVVEYADDKYDKIEIFAFFIKEKREHLYVYPKVDKNALYKYCDMTLSGEKIVSQGIKIPIDLLRKVKWFFEKSSKNLNR